MESFFNTIENEFWLFGASSGGNLLLWSKPREDNNFNMALRIEEKHKSDIITIDCSNKLIITGDDNGSIGIWNIFSG